MAISDYLNSLIKDKKNLVANLNEKGVEASDSETFTELAPKVLDIQSGGDGDLDWSEIGYSEAPQTIIDGFNYAKEIYDNWTPRTSLNSYFSGDTKLVFMPLVDTSNVIDFTSMFKNCYNLISVPVLDFSKNNSFFSMFRGCSSLKSIPLIDTSKGTDMTNMFYGCSSLESIPLIDTSSVTNFSYMFNGCSSLKSIPLIDTSKGTDMTNMFNDCWSLKEIPNLVFSSATSLASAFDDCGSLTFLSSLSLPNATDLSRMFAECHSLTEVELTDLSNVTDTSYMFYYCYSLRKITFKGLNTTKIKQSNNMFSRGPQTSCLILVDTEEVKNWIKTTFPTYTNVFLINEAHSISIDNDNIQQLTNGYNGNPYSLICLEDKKIVTSFYLNGTLVEGNTFTMPDENVKITNITISDGYIVESNHYPPQSGKSWNETVTFEGATSLQVTLTKEFSYWRDSISVINSSGVTIVSGSGTGSSTRTVTTNNNSATVVCNKITTSDSSSANIYGFKVTIIPIYE